jgi:hypothetical protein
MPSWEYGSSYRGWLLFTIAGPAGNVGPNTYTDLSLPIETLPVQGIALFILARAPTIHQSTPQLMISDCWLIDPSTVGIRWMNTTGGSVSIPETNYQILVLV